MTTETSLLAEGDILPQDTWAGMSKIDRFKWKVKDRKGSFMYISKGLLRFDHDHYQRVDIKQKKVLDIAREWSWIACGAILVAKRGDAYFVIDGQYRTLAALRRSDIADLPCLVFPVHDIKDEAAGFLDVNTQRKPITSKDKFKALVTTDDPAAAFVQDLLESSQRGISNANSGTARCLSSLLKWARQKPDTLRHIWPLLDEVCRDHYVHVHLVEGFMYLESQLREGETLASPRWRSRLVRVGYSGLLDAMHKAQGFRGTGGGKVFAEGILQAVNRGLKNKLTCGTGE